MVLSYLVHKPPYYIHRYLVHAVVVVAVLGEIALHVVVNDYSVFVAYAFYLGVLNRAERVGDNRKSRDTGSEPTLNITVVKRHLKLFVAVFIVHIMNDVEGIDIQAREPFHHIVVLFHNVVKVEIIALNGAVFRPYLDFKPLVNTAVYSVKQALGEVCPRAEELHFLADAHRGNAARYRVVVAVGNAHHIVILVLNRRGVD